MPHSREVTITMTPEELKALVKSAFHEEMERLGLNAGEPDSREDIRKDMMFLRSMRQRIDGAAAKIGYALLTGICALIASIFMFGLQSKIGK